MKKLFVLVFIMIIASSCKVVTKIASVSSGGISSTNLHVSGTIIKGLSNNETFASYKKDGVSKIEPSNIIEFQLLKKVKKDKTKYKGDKVKRDKVKKDKVKGDKTGHISFGCFPFGIGRNKIKKEKGENISNVKSKGYTYVKIDKSFFKRKFFTKIFQWVFFIPSFGTTAYLSKSEKKTIDAETCKEGDLCKGDGYKRKILLDARIWCKKDQINDTVTLIENFPDAFSVINYKVKIKRGKGRISSVISETKNQNGYPYYSFKVIGKDGVLKKKNHIKIIFNAYITLTDKYYLPEFQDKTVPVITNNTPVNNNSNTNTNSNVLANTKPDSTHQTVQKIKTDSIITPNNITNNISTNNNNNTNTSTKTNTNTSTNTNNITNNTTPIKKDSIIAPSNNVNTNIKTNTDNKPTTRFYIIAGAYTTQALAEDAVKELKLKGFPAEVVGKSDQGYYRVCYCSFDTKEAATKELARIKASVTQGAWILEK